MIENNDISKVKFITLTNDGYLDYTLNCLKSLEKINFYETLHCYTIGSNSHNKLLSLGYSSEEINDKNISTNFEEWQSNNIGKIYQQKFHIIYKNLLDHKYVCFTDGDIVFNNNNFLKYCIENIKDHDILIQNNNQCDDDKSEVCSGFMFIKSNKITIDLFNPKHTEKFKDNKGWGDQLYVNNVLNKFNFKILPLNLFPNGKYFNLNTIIHHKKNPTINMLIKNSYLTHFNYIVGNKKKESMKKCDVWYL